MQSYIFLVIAAVSVFAAVQIVTVKNLVHGALYLVIALLGVATTFLLLTAEFLAWVQVLIYVGAVVVLLLFALMLTRAPTGPLEEAPLRRAVPAAVVAGLVGGLLSMVVVAGFRGQEIDLETAVVGSASVTGASVFESWVLPFELLSVLLLAALVGAIVLSRGRAGGEGEEDR